MSASHHGAFPDRQKTVVDLARHAALMERFESQVNGTAKRQYSQGRISGDDDGDLAIAMTTDLKKHIIMIRFGQPTEWIGLGLREAQEIRDMLTARIMELKGTPVEA